MVRSQKQIEASRKNGAKSKGPTSGPGTRNVNRGMLAGIVLMEGESRKRFEALHRTLTDYLAPENVLERLLIGKIVVAHWRLMRLWSMQKALNINGNQNSSVEDAATRHVLTLIEQARSSGILHRHESSCDRQFSRAFANFFRIRAASQAAALANNSPESREVVETIGQLAGSNPKNPTRIPPES